VDPLDEANFVVVPHVLAPFPSSIASWVRPSLGDLAFAGMFNAGLFSLRRSESSRRFLETWADLCSAPGCFVQSLGGQTDQHSFNWVLCFADRVVVLKDPSYNVGYWNLHDRSVRWCGLDDGASEAWTVNGRPLSCFHFSGFSPEQPLSLSHFDHRYSMVLMF